MCRTSVVRSHRRSRRSQTGLFGAANAVVRFRAALIGSAVVAGDYPQLLADRDVTIIRSGHNELTRLRGWLDGWDGPVPTYRIELVVRIGNYASPYTATGPDMFEALVRLRRQLEPDGLAVAVQGARRDTYPSGIARDMAGGMKVYLMHPGRAARMEDLVETLQDALPDQLATVGDQRAFFDEWIASKRPSG
jgi:hypothetical protein